MTAANLPNGDFDLRDHKNRLRTLRLLLNARVRSIKPARRAAGVGYAKPGWHACRRELRAAWNFHSTWRNERSGNACRRPARHAAPN